MDAIDVSEKPKYDEVMFLAYVQFDILVDIDHERLFLICQR